MSPSFSPSPAVQHPAARLTHIWTFLVGYCASCLLQQLAMLKSTPLIMRELLPTAQALGMMLMCWKALCFLTGCSAPLMVVASGESSPQFTLLASAYLFSGSMEPAFYRGDILILWNRTANVALGDIPVLWFKDHPLPMVHRVITTSWNQNEYEIRIMDCCLAAAHSSYRLSGVIEQLFTTKGDNNEVDDVSLYPDGRLTAKRGEITGFVRGYVPFIGWPALLVQEVLFKLRGPIG